MQDHRFNPSQTPFTAVVPPASLNAPIDEHKSPPSERDISLGTGQILASESSGYTSMTTAGIEVNQSVEAEQEAGVFDSESEEEGVKDSDHEGIADSDSGQEAHEGAERAENVSLSAKKPQPFLGVTRILGNMTFGKVLGSGAFGEVYQGQWGDRTVALKKIDIEHAKKYLGNTLNEQDILESLEWEVSRLSTVNHPNCVQFYGIYEHPIEKQVYLVMEFCDGGTLEGVLKKGNPSWPTRWQWALEMSQGLAYLHQAGILHRDLKAENVLLDKHGCGKLADLGVAQVDALLADKAIKAVEEGLQDLSFISPEKSLANYNRDMAKETPEGQHTRLLWLSAHEKFPSIAEMDTHVIYLKETSPTRICASWCIGNKEKTTFTVDKKKREQILSCFTRKTVIDRSDDAALFDDVTELCGYTPISLSDTPAMDLYALGFVFWQMVSGGKKPRCNGTPINDMPQDEWVKWMFGTSPENYEREPIPNDCPPEWRQLILDCWQHDPEKRPTAEGLVKRIEGILSTQHEQSVVLQTCEALESLIHPKRLEALSYLPPYLTQSRVDEPIETYWQRFEGSMKKAAPAPTTTTTTTTTTTMTTTTTALTTTVSPADPAADKKDNPPVDLKETLDDFLKKPGSGVLLLLGEAGLGKTLTTYRLADAQVQAWRDYLNTPKAMQGEAPYLPIFIRPTLKRWSHSALTDTFTQAKEKYGLDQTATPLRFLVIVDGYDECQLDSEPQNLCTQLGIVHQSSGEHPSVKVVVTCRPNTVPELQLKERFGLSLSRDPGDRQKALEVRYFLPFNFDQIVTYLTDRLGWDESTQNTYAQKLKTTEKLREVLRNPFVLQLFVQSWETLIPAEASDPNPSNKDLFETLNRSKIYQGFIAHWLKTQHGLLDKGVRKALMGQAHTPTDETTEAAEKTELHSLIARFEQFASEVAFTAFQEKGITLDTKKVESLPSRWGHLKALVEADSQTRFKEREAKRDEKTQRRALLTQADFTHIMHARLGQFQSGSPLKEKTFGVEFSHKSFFEYFVAQRILSLATENPTSAVKEGLILLNTRPIQEEPEVLDFLAEGWSEETAKRLTPMFFEMITASRRNPQIKQSSANAATMLNHCRVSFSGKELSDVRLPGANLSQAMLDNTRFHGAHLQNVTLRQAFLRETDLTDADLTGAHFGEYPSIECENTVRCVAYSPDGNYLAAGVGETVHVWEITPEGQKEIATFEEHQAAVMCLAFDLQGDRIVSGSEDKTLKLWETQTGKEVATLKGHTKGVSSCEFDPTGRRIVSGSGDNTLKLWEVQTGKELATLTGHSGSVYSCAFDATGGRIVSGSEDNTLKLWEAQTGKVLATLTGHTNIVISCAFDPTGGRIVSGSFDKTLKLWEAQTGKVLATLTGHTGQVTSCAFDPTGGRIVSGSWDQTLKLWDAQTGKELATLKGHTSIVMSCAFDATGGRIVSGSWDQTLKLWEAQTGQELATLKGHTDDVRSCAFDPTGGRIVSGSFDKTLKLWEAHTGKELATLKGHTKEVRSCAFDPTGGRIVSGSHDETLKLWEVQTGKELATLKGHSWTVSSCEFDPTGGRIVSGSGDNTLKLWEAQTGKELATLTGHSGSVYSCAFDPTGGRIVSGSFDKTLKLWEAHTGKELATLKGHTKEVRSCAFDPTGGRIVSGSYDGTLKLWEAQTGKELATLKGHTDPVMSCAFDPTGGRIVSGSYDGTLKLWEAQTGKELATLKGHTDVVRSCAFDPTGGRIVSGSSDTSIWVWESLRTDGTKWMVVWRTGTWPLHASGVFLQGTKLSHQNKDLLLQRDAIDESPALYQTSERSSECFASFWRRGAQDDIPLTIVQSLQEEEQRSLACVNQDSYRFFQSRRASTPVVTEVTETASKTPANLSQ